jgi:hypothetical protein
MIRFDPKNPKGIVWLASFPRSGNTWTRIFLSRLLAAVAGTAPGPVDLNRRNDFEASDAEPALYRPLLGRPLGQATPAEIAAVRPQVQRTIHDKANGLVLVKTHNANTDYFGVPLITREVSAGAVYVVRNPLDVAVSFARFRAIPIDRAIADMATPDLGSPTSAERIYWASGSWSINVASWTARADPTILVVRYEDMLDAPLVAFDAIARHVGIGPLSPEQLAGAIKQSSFAALSALEARTGFREKPATADRFFRAGRAGQWREALTATQVRRVIAAHGEQMRRFGYLPD